MRADGKLRLDEGACLPLRSAFGQCRACETACPTKAIRVEIEAVLVDAQCTACGRCASACPTGAIQAAGFDDFRAAAPSPARERIECARVPAGLRTPATRIVPCLGGLTVGDLVARCAGGGDVEVVDRGWCGQCVAGGAGLHAAEVAVRLATLWTESVGANGRFRLAAMPTDAGLMQSGDLDLPGNDSEEPDASRRSFLRRVVPLPEADRVTPMGSAGRAAHPASTRRESVERRRLLDALDRLSAASGVSVPAEFFPRLTNNGQCVDHRVCAAACPTGALKSTDHEGRAALEHAPEACIACGACARACPEGALSLDPHGGSRERRFVALHRQAECTNCSDVFSPVADETECATCRKSRRFMSDAMTRLFASPPRP